MTIFKLCAGIALAVVSCILILHCQDTHAGSIATNQNDLVNRVREHMVSSEFDVSLIEKLRDADTEDTRKLLCELLNYSIKGDAIPELPAALRKSLEADVRAEAGRALVTLGSGCVVPVLRGWLREDAAKSGVTEQDQTLEIAIQGLGEFADKESLVRIAGVYQTASCHGQLREAAAEAVAAIGGSDETNILSQIVWDECLDIGVRCDAAAALVRQGSGMGREFLLTVYDLYLLRLKTQGTSDSRVARKQLERIGDTELMSSLKLRAERETHKTARNNINSLLGEMAICAMPIEQVIEIAQNDVWAAGMYKRYPAIGRLGREGGTELLPILALLKPWKTVDTGAYDIQQNILKSIARGAARKIRKRHWSELKES